MYIIARLVFFTSHFKANSYCSVIHSLDVLTAYAIFTKYYLLYADNNNNELLKYKQSFYIIKKTINLLKNHYYNKINDINSLRAREKKLLVYLKRKIIILEDKCAFYSEHVEQLKKIYREQINLKNNKTQNLQDEVNNISKTSEEKIESNSTRILKLREDQIERLSQQLDSINNLYLKQVDSNKKLIMEVEELNKSILYLNNKIQEEKNNRNNVKRKLKFYMRYNRNKKQFKLNMAMLNKEEERVEKEEEKEDVCLSILCILKTELEMMDEEKKKKKYGDDKDKIILKNNNSFFKKIFNSNYKMKKKKNTTLFDTIYKKQFFSFYEKAFIENNKMKFDKIEKKKIFSIPLKNVKKSNNYDNIHNELKENIEEKEVQKREVKKKESHNKKNDRWNYLTLSNIYFYNNFNNNFDDEKNEHFHRNADGSNNRRFRRYRKGTSEQRQLENRKEGILNDAKEAAWKGENMSNGDTPSSGSPNGSTPINNSTNNYASNRNIDSKPISERTDMNNDNPKEREIRNKCNKSTQEDIKIKGADETVC
ncbi:conserved Plasmodium protein, unknown function [Plasmodium malariae]|uniref:Uncharacterized protein n=2 Tax=Plasmodium malariae TaxID=5858 RepID=A0A1D3TFI7_PLAMA|nr:conserved Plasmodium protein, unknown function [Plasmodium malariae]SCP03726.1 conserved Plasmodium protein, unknown function [Plasmodium malariae]